MKKESFQRTGGSDSALQNYRKLVLNRIDLWPMPNAVAAHILKSENVDIDSTLEVAYKLEEMSGWYYLAANLETPDEIIIKIQNAMKKIKQSNFLTKVIKRWSL